MKRKIIVLLLVFPCTAVSMERPPVRVEPPVQTLVQPPAAAPAAAPLPTIYGLSFPVAGTTQAVYETINLQAIEDPIAFSTLAELLTKELDEKSGFILARVTTKMDDIYSKEYYSLENINRALFKGLYPSPGAIIDRYNFLSPLRAHIVGEINYFIFNPVARTFEHLGTDADLYAIAQKNFKWQSLSEKQKFFFDIMIALDNQRQIQSRSIGLYNIGLFYENRKKSATASHYYQAAAKLGNSSAMNNLGNLNITLPRPPNYQAARTWYMGAANLGNPTAMLNLGMMDSIGRGLATPNYQSAQEWLNKALKANPSPKDKAKIEKMLANIKEQLQTPKRSAPESSESQTVEGSGEQPAAKKQK